MITGRTISLAFFFAIAALAPLAAADGQSGPLYDTILAEDAQLFAAFNACDMTTLGTKVASDLQFFHDHDGLSVGRDAFMQSVTRNVCGKFTRTLEPHSVEVWPLPGYGALEVGVHRFHHADHSPDGIGKFMIVWKQTAGRWVMAESFSYAHADVTQ